MQPLVSDLAVEVPGALAATPASAPGSRFPGSEKTPHGFP